MDLLLLLHVLSIFIIGAFFIVSCAWTQQINNGECAICIQYLCWFYAINRVYLV